MNETLFRVALRYIEKGYSREDLRWGDALYNAPKEDIDQCLDYYDEIIEEGTNWAYKQLKNINNES